MVRCNSPIIKNQRSLACPYYTLCSPNSKPNLPDPKKARNAVSGSCIPCLPLSCRSLHRRPPICFGSSVHVLFGFAEIGKKRYYTFIASPKIPWDRLWSRVWKMIPQPQTNGRLLVALDDYLNPKTGKKIFGCARMFDHAAKQNQSRYPWAQNVVAIGLLKVIKGRWACLPLSQRYYFTKDDISKNQPTFKGKKSLFKTNTSRRWRCLRWLPGNFPGSGSWSWLTPGLVIRGSGNRCVKPSASLGQPAVSSTGQQQSLWSA
jgi:hypothetical protein